MTTGKSTSSDGPDTEEDRLGSSEITIKLNGLTYRSKGRRATYLMVLIIGTVAWLTAEGVL
jgi:hypothetical protein